MQHIPNLSGQRLGPYELKELIGGGGMGQVYKAWEPSLERWVAVKIMREDLGQEPEYEERFKREAKVAANLRRSRSNINIVEIYSAGEERGFPYIGMAFLSGGSLEDEIKAVQKRGTQYGASEAARILEKVAEALDYAHTEGVVHRDIKPANILFDSDRNPVLVDFGIVKLLNHERLTKTDHIVGTQYYMAPEQWASADIDGRADQYSLACTLYELLTGSPPFTGQSVIELMEKHRNELPRPIHELRRDLSPELTQVMNRALSKQRGERYKTIGEFAKAFKEAIATSQPIPPVVVITKQKPEDNDNSTFVGQPAATSSGKLYQRIGIGAAVLTAIVLIGLILLSRLSQDRSIAPSNVSTDVAQGPEATALPSVTATMIVTDTAAPPTATIAPTATQTATSTPVVPIPASLDESLNRMGIDPETGTLLQHNVPTLVHDKDNNRHTWYDIGSTSGSGSIRGTFAVQTDFAFTSPDNRCSVAAWWGNDTGVKFDLTSDGVLVVNQIDRGQYNSKVFQTDNLLAGSESLNRLLMIADGSIFSVYLNDSDTPVLIVTLRYSSWLNIQSYNPQTNMPACRFANTWVWESNEEDPLPPAIASSSSRILNSQGFNAYSGIVTGGFDALPPLALSENSTNPPAWNSSVQDPLTRQYSDFVLHARVTFGDRDDECGVYFRENTETSGYYAVIVGKNSSEGFLYFQDHGELGDSSGFPATETTQTVELVLVATEGRFSAYVDGVLVREYSDMENKSPEGGLSFASWSVGGANEPGTPTCGFSDVWVWEPIQPPSDALIAMTVSFSGIWDQDRQIFVLDTRTGLRVQLTDCGLNGNASWSPDGTKIAYASTCITDTNANGDSEIWIMNADGSNKQQITNTGEWEDLPAWSSDGTQLVYTVRGAAADIYTLQINPTGFSQGTALTSANTSESETYPIWSPNGNLIAFSARLADGSTSLCYVKSDNTQQRSCIDQGNLEEIFGYGRSTWMADSQSVLLRQAIDGEMDQLMSTSLTGNTSQVINGPWGVTYPFAASDNSTVFFFRDVNNTSHIYRMRFNGSGVERVSNGPGYEWNPAFWDLAP